MFPPPFVPVWKLQKIQAHSMTPEIEKLQLNCQDANVHIEISCQKLSHDVEI